METAVLSTVLSMLGPKLYTFLQENHELRRNLEHDIQYIRNELRMIAAVIDEHERRQLNHGDLVQGAWIHGVRELAYDMEDCIDRFTHRVTSGHRLTTVSVRTKFAAMIEKLRKRSEDLSKLRSNYTTVSNGNGDCEASSSRAILASETTHVPTGDTVPVGMDGPRDEILELIMETQGQPNHLKVISVVGFGGLGKTLLAWKIYRNTTICTQFQPRAWVSAAGKSAGDVLKEILCQLGFQSQAQEDEHRDVSKLITSLKKCLHSKRFFIVIDDIQREYWNSTIKDAFPVDTGSSSIVMVTTAIHSIANACSSSNGHVYVMSTLDKNYSRKLFLREASWGDYPPGSEIVVSTKCDGLPLALVSTAQFLKSKGHQLPQEYAKMCGNLGMHLEREHTLERMKHVLVHNYTSLPGHVIKACLLYFGIFPCGHPIRREKLIRRWSAEGLVEADPFRSSLDVAMDYFKELVNRSIIQPVAVSSNTEVKTCQTHGMMLEFILHKSKCDNFITLLYDQARLPDKMRCLSVQYNSARRGRMTLDIDLSHVRSLTIFGKAEDSILEFSSYELLRVLDLEECDNLKDEHLRKICKLLLLRYLSLGGPIMALPKEITKLKFLETLDVQRTKIKILPIQVIKLPCLTHLFGMFKLEDVGQKMSKLQNYLSKKSKLETLAGFFTNNGQGFPQLIDHMNNLEKVKIRCETTSDASTSVHLSKAIQVFVQRGTNINNVRSLSLNFGECFQDQEKILNFPLEDSCYLCSLKLKGKIKILPPFVTLLKGLTELCLSCSDLLNGDVLAALSNVHCLHYLKVKLITCHLDKFVIGQGPLKSLRRFCIVVQSMPHSEIQLGALPNLESFRLLCKDLNGLCGINIQYLGPKCLKEVTLEERMSEQTKEKWKQAVKSHPRQPKVSFVNTGEVGEVQNMEVAQPADNAAALALATDTPMPVPVF